MSFLANAREKNRLQNSTYFGVGQECRFCVGASRLGKPILRFKKRLHCSLAKKKVFKQDVTKGSEGGKEKFLFPSHAFIP